MEKKTPRSLLPFDELTMPGDLYLLKLLLPFIPAHMQKLLAIFIKYLELSYTLRTFQGFARKEFSLQSVSELLPYMDPDSSDKLRQLEMMMQMFSMSENDTDFNPSDILNGMFTDTQQEEFAAYSQMFDDALNKDFGKLVVFDKNEIKAIPLSETAGKLKFVDPECEVVSSAKKMGITFGE